MKLSTVVVLCMFVFFGVGIARADDISDMKDQIKALQETINSLNSKIQNLETKQEAQAEQVKKVPELDKKVSGLTDKVPELDKKVSGLGEINEKAKSLLDGVTVGGHLKFALLDRTDGKRNGVRQHDNLSGGLFGRHNLYLYFTKELENWLKLDVQTETDVASSATPSLGSDITRTSNTTLVWSIHQAFMTVLFPKDYELKVGTFNAMFSEDYARETWWHQLYNMNKGMCTLQAWHDSGAELYKNFDFDKWSLPIYLSYLNGNTLDQNMDNNENKMVLVHVAPEFFQGKFRLLESFGYGKWDNKDSQDNYRLVSGFDWKYKKFNLMGEYIYWQFKNVVVPSTGILPTADGRREGYWIKAIYTFNPKWRAVIEQSFANLYQAALTTTQNTMLSDKYYSTDLAVDYSLTPNSTIIGQYEHGDDSRSDGSESLVYDRFTVGWRTTF